jgi:hypothetical protein
MVSPQGHVTKQLHLICKNATKWLQKGKDITMENKVIKEYQVSYFKDISRAINIHQLANLIQYHAGAADEKADLLERERAAKMRMVNSIKMRACDTERIISGFEEYGDTIQSVYFEIGVQIGICLQAELLKNKSNHGETERDEEYEKELQQK